LIRQRVFVTTDAREAMNVWTRPQSVRRKENLSGGRLP
jgi:hypothetical protein